MSTCSADSVTSGQEASAGPRIVRFEVWLHPDEPDRHARQIVGLVEDGKRILAARSAKVYLIQGLTGADAIQRVGGELLADGVAEDIHVGVRPSEPGHQTIEVHHQPGVMDPVAQSTWAAITELLPEVDGRSLEVRTALRVEVQLEQPARENALRHLATRHFANPVIQDIHFQPWCPERFPIPPHHPFELVHVRLLNLDDEGLMRLSRQGHLFLSLEEMRAVQAWFRQRAAVAKDDPDTSGASGDSGGGEPTDVELETIAQTWSEHCVHKTLKSTVRYRSEGEDPVAQRWVGRAGHETESGDGGSGPLVIRNLLKSTIAQATRELCEDEELGRWCISVFKDNAGIVRFDDEHGVCIKVETHNHPSAIEPYGGAATGIGGCIRDIMGTGLFAWPIANTNVFCVADPEMDEADLPRGVIHPRRVLEQVVAGVRDYGNRKGIPTVNGAVYFHDAYLGNPLVFAGSVGLIALDRCFGDARPGDLIVALGGRTGRDGIHGATFSSAELTDQHADEFGHAVQIGNAITQKRVMDVLQRAAHWKGEAGDEPVRCLFHAITDCGAGGFSSAVGEMGAQIGAEVELDAAPLKYDGLTYREIWISEAQERMVIAASEDDLPSLRRLCAAEDVELCVLGRFGSLDAKGEAQLVLRYSGREVGRLGMSFLHDGIPMPTRQAVWREPARPKVEGHDDESNAIDPVATLISLLEHPNIAAKHWIIRQYDHEVQGGSVIKPLMGPGQDAPQNGAVLRPKLSSRRGIALGCGLQTAIGDPERGGDSYWMALAAVDEAVRNVVSIGADPSRIAILDNFCWPGCDDPRVMASLVRACEGCYDAALAYRTPFVSGKDSLNNQFTTESGRIIRIPPTLLITAMGMVDDTRLSVSSDAKRPGNLLLIIGPTGPALLGSHLCMVHPEFREPGTDEIPKVDLKAGPAHARAVASLMRERLAVSVHDVSDGGVLVAASEMSFGGRLGMEIDLSEMPFVDESRRSIAALGFGETPSRYLIEAHPDDLPRIEALLGECGVGYGIIGTMIEEPCMRVHVSSSLPNIELDIEVLRRAWLRRLDW
ncbi:MAG: phosphoribosylformylglycinamidine synthase subunit PurS [Phycisphaeraceae bacterium]|nr:phosphoribosylformylglycinamidine synthase subunit PurS [Phycisphaeraceae bacterium]